MIRLLTATAFAALLAGAASAQTAVPFGHFESVELRGGGHVVLHRGDAQRVSVIKGSTQFTSFHIEDGNQLVIDACNDHCPAHYDLEIDIATPNIHGVAVQGGGSIVGKPGFPAQDSIAAAVKEGGAIDLRAIDARSVTAAVSGGGQIAVRPGKSLIGAINGGGEIRYSGHPNVTSAVNGGGEITRDGD